MSTIKALMKMFATHGIPEQIVSDNGTQFTSDEFKSFCNANNIKHSLSATYHPSTNGETERFVQTFKNNMKCRQATSSTIGKCINSFLLAYRITPHASTGCEPSFLLMGRRIRCRLDFMRPDFVQSKRQEGWMKAQDCSNFREFKMGDSVMVRTYTSSDTKWTKFFFQSVFYFL